MKTNPTRQPTPEGLSNLAQGCEERATLGEIAKAPTNPGGVVPRPFGWEIEVEFSKGMIYAPGWQGNWRKTFHYKTSSEGSARSKAMLKRHARAVISTKPIATEAAYISAYGNYWERGL